MISLLRSFTWQRVRWLPAILLAVAAALKLASLVSGEPMLLFQWGGLRLVLGLVIAEIAIAAWIFTGKRKKEVCISTLLLFLAFAVINGILVFVGQSKCDCFGGVVVAPTWSLMLNVSVAGLVALSLAVSDFDRLRGSWLRTVIYVVLGATSIGLLTSPASVSTIARLRGCLLYTSDAADE